MLLTGILKRAGAPGGAKVRGKALASSLLAAAKRGEVLFFSRPFAGAGRDNPNKSETVRGFVLTPGERADLIEFLNSLTDTAPLTEPRFSAPGPPR